MRHLAGDLRRHRLNASRIMKYITFCMPGFIPVPILFSPMSSHIEMAKMIGMPVLSAGFCRIDDGKVQTSGFSTSLNCGPEPIDAKLIEHAFELTAAQYPKAPEPLAAQMFSNAQPPH